MMATKVPIPKTVTWWGFIPLESAEFRYGAMWAWAQGKSRRQRRRMAGKTEMDAEEAL